MYCCTCVYPVICCCGSKIIHFTIMCTTTWNLVTTVAAQEKPPIIKCTHTITLCICTKSQEVLKSLYVSSVDTQSLSWNLTHYERNQTADFAFKHPLMLQVIGLWVSVRAIHAPHKLLNCWLWTQEGMLYLEVCQPTKTLERVGARVLKIIIKYVSGR